FRPRGSAVRAGWARPSGNVPLQRPLHGPAESATASGTTSASDLPLTLYRSKQRSQPHPAGQLAAQQEGPAFFGAARAERRQQLRLPPDPAARPPGEGRARQGGQQRPPCNGAADQVPQTQGGALGRLPGKGG